MSGNVALILSLSLVPIPGFIGPAVDYTRASKLHSAIDDSADSAALAAVAKESINPKQITSQQGTSATAWFPSADFYPPYSNIAAGARFPHAVPDAAHPEMEIEGVDLAWCQKFKDKNIDVMTLVTPYVVPTPANGGNAADAAELRTIYIRDVIAPIIPDQMKACASSPAYFYSASSPAEINAAMISLFKNATTKVSRLSQ